jgi:uncharacterized protein YkwD
MQHHLKIARRFTYATAATTMLAVGMGTTGVAEAEAGPRINKAERKVLSQINRYRASRGLRRLRVNGRLTRAAEWMSRDMGRHHRFSHTDSRGRSPFGRIAAFGYPSRNTWRGENLAAGNPSPRGAFMQWRNSPAHDANMRGRYYRSIGIARVRVPGSPYGWYWTTTFGSR